MSLEHTNESYVDRFTFLTPDSRRAVLAISHVYDEIDQVSKTNREVSDKKDSIVANFHKGLKAYCEAQLGNRKLWEEVPEAQKLIGGSLEPRIDITDEQFNDISNQVQEIISTLEAMVGSVSTPLTTIS